MKIFIGGQKKHHQDRIRQAYPDVDFEFATYDDPQPKWVARAKSCDYVIVDQSRCSHPIVDALRRRHVVHYADGKREIHELIERLLHGKAQPSYIATWLAI